MTKTPRTLRRFTDPLIFDDVSLCKLNHFINYIRRLGFLWSQSRIYKAYLGDLLELIEINIEEGIYCIDFVDFSNLDYILKIDSKFLMSRYLGFEVDFLRKGNVSIRNLDIIHPPL